ncbi:MAG: TrpB-like pyridoxal phosphate-dependent enzyme, partial [Betaproteobacteria bacterium HGW-Betaproteobacteria-14]
MSDIKILLNEADIPTHWYNVVADMPKPPLPPLAPDGNPVTPEQMLAIFPGPLLEQEMSGERWIPIPEEVREIYKQWRPSPMFRARRLEKMLGTPAKIYYKYEGVSPAGSHKVNTSVPQAFFNKMVGITRLTTETGAGQWGSSMALAGQMFGIEVRVYMVKVSYNQKPFRRSMMQTWGAEVFASPTDMTNSGRTALAADPNNPGSLGLAISEAVEEAASRKDTNYCLGSVLNHVCLHQTVIGLEAKKQFEKVGDYPDMVFACCGGGSNFAGTAFPFLADKAAGKKVRLVAAEPSSCPSLTKGVYAYDFGDVSGYTPLMKMYTLGHDFMPPSIHAGGLRYHGDSPLVCQLYNEGLIEAVAV